MALESNNGSYELIQFAQAEIQSDGKWRLSKLLRAQLGTELEMLAGSAVGARAILLNEAVFPMELKDSDVGLEQFWRVGPASDNNSASTYASIAHTNNLRSKRMLSPVHLRAYKSSSDDYHIAWIRRGTLNADNWEGSDIPFDTQDEKYNIRIMDLGNSIRRELTTTSQNFLYTKLMLIADFGSNHADFCVVVSQLNNSGDPGSPRKLKILKPN